MIYSQAKEAPQDHTTHSQEELLCASTIFKWIAGKQILNFMVNKCPQKYSLISGVISKIIKNNKEKKNKSLRARLEFQ